MQNVLNEARIEKGARIGKIATFAGLGFLGAGLVISLVLQASSLIWISFACLLLGLLVSTIGTMNMNRWVREPRADQAMVQALKGFDDRYRLYNYYLPAPHVLLSPLGLTVITAMGQDGVIRFEGGKFHRNFSVLRLLRFMAEEGMGKPFAEADAQVEAVQKLLDEEGLGDEVEIKSVVLFHSPKAELQITAPPRPITDTKGLKKAIRKIQSNRLPEDLYLEIGTLFDRDVDWD
jgi:hypothetical protein